MICPCKDCELRKVEVVDGVIHDCHSNCPKDKDGGFGYVKWKATHPKQRDMTSDEADRYQRSNNFLKTQSFVERQRRGMQKFSFGMRNSR